MIAFHVPPVATSSGVQRTLKFVRYLGESGWHPLLLTAQPRAYPRTDIGQLAEIPADVPVRRAFCLDASRHLAIGGKYPAFLAWPDPWASWILGAVPRGLQMIRRYRPAVLWSTYPLATAHLVGAILARLSGLPWVADFRDPMTMQEYPTDPMRRRLYGRIEKLCMIRAAKCIFTTPGVAAAYGEKYPQIATRSQVIPNGFDESNFEGLLDMTTRAKSRKPYVLVHSGSMPEGGRNPAAFFTALSRLRRSDAIGGEDVVVRFRGTQREQALRDLAEENGISDMVTFESYLPYRDAIREMVSADGLLIFQGQQFKHQIPAKIYEYLFARRPIFALTDPGGATAELLGDAGVGEIVDIENVDAIEKGLTRFLSDLSAGTSPVADEIVLRQYSRREHARQLAEIFDTVSSSTQ
jgi:glycosyltransferase involved in cell wall biosynthesis